MARCKAEGADNEGAYLGPFSLSREQNQTCLDYAEARKRRRSQRD